MKTLSLAATLFALFAVHAQAADCDRDAVAMRVNPANGIE